MCYAFEYLIYPLRIAANSLVENNSKKYITICRLFFIKKKKKRIRRLIIVDLHKIKIKMLRKPIEYE